jgi:hypothetical protein
MAFSAIWHTQWKTGSASEASIGKAMLHASPGFITLVDTPSLGAVTMIGEGCARSLSHHGTGEPHRQLAFDHAGALLSESGPVIRQCDGV